MTTGGTVSSLMFMTLGVVAVIVLIVLILFLRKRKNRHPMQNVRERNIEEIRRGDPPKQDR